MTATTAATRYLLKGDWMEDGYLADLAPRHLHVTIHQGRAYHSDIFGCPDDAGRIKIDIDGCLRAWGAGVSFSPDDGEIDRIGGPALFQRPDEP